MGPTRVYDTAIHPAVDMTPREAFKMGITRSGARIHCLIDYDDTFRFFSLPTTPKGTATVEPGRGVKINHLYYWSDDFRPSTIEHTQVPIRYDPFDIGVAYAFVQGRWIRCISEYHLQFKGHSERELLLATAEVRKRLRNQSKEISITARRLAEFLASAEAHEVVLTQRLQDVEAQDVLTQMGGYQGALYKEQEHLPESETLSQIPPSEQEQSEEEADVYAGLEIYEEYR